MKIRCAICQKSVDEIVTWHDEARRRWIVEVTCHGEEDTMVMDFGFVAGLNRDERTQLERSEGVAFATKRIAAA